MDIKIPRRNVLRALPSVLLLPLAGCQTLSTSTVDDNSNDRIGGHALGGLLVEEAPNGAEVTHVTYENKDKSTTSLLLEVIDGAVEKSRYSIQVSEEQVPEVRETLSNVPFYRGEELDKSGYYFEKGAEIIRVTFFSYD